MIGRGKLFLNSRDEKLLFYVAIIRASGFRASLKIVRRAGCHHKEVVRKAGLTVSVTIILLLLREGLH